MVVEGKLKSLLPSIAADELTPVPNVLSFHQLEMSHFASTRGIVNERTGKDQGERFNRKLSAEHACLPI